jgi:hypothetical protein
VAEEAREQEQAGDDGWEFHVGGLGV